MKIKYYFVAAFFMICMAFNSDRPAYQIYNNKGKEIKYSKMISELKEADIILFGEMHDNPVGHWLELKLAKDLYEERKQNLILAAEMFETDNQLMIDEYLSGKISSGKFDEDARLWKNYRTDYKPLLSFAKDNKLKFIGSNIPRRYAAIVFGKGFEALDSLSTQAKSYIAPLPILYDSNLVSYKKMLDMKEGMGGQHINPNLPKAQAIKDATMAYSILRNWSAGKQVIHYNGSYHSDNYEGIVWYLKQMNKNLKVMTISSVYQGQLDSLNKESEGLGDFIIAVEEDMTRTY